MVVLKHIRMKKAKIASRKHFFKNNISRFIEMLEKLERKLFTMILKQLTYWFDFQNREIEYLHKITSQSISRTTIFL